MDTERKKSALKVLFVFSLAALACDDATLKINQGETSGDAGAEMVAGGGGGTGGGSTGGGIAGGGSAGGGSTGGGSGGGGSTGGGSTGGGSTGGGSAGGGSTGGGSAGGGSAGGGSAGGGSAGGGSAGGGTGGMPGTVDAAVVVSHTIPAQLACSQTMNITVTIRNTGDTTWTAAGNYRLGAVDDTDPFFTSGNRIELGASVAPGQEHTFNIALVAPGAGTHTTDWRMVRDGVHWFGDIATRAVTVACTSQGPFYPCVIDGQFNMPDHDQRIASRNASLIRTGHTVTGNDSIDNAVLGGGSPDGGIWLSGQFHFEIDVNGQITSASWITVFSPVHYTVTGGVYPNGEIHMGSPAGLDISGLISNGMITGYVAEAGMSITRGDAVWNSLSVTDRNNLRGIWHGNDLEYVHGLMSGTWAAR